MLFLGTGKKYLSEIAEHLKRAPQTVDFHLKILENAGLVSSSSEEGKVFYQLKDRSILKFLRERRPIPALHHPKPPHEIVEDAMNEITKRLDEIEKRLERIERKLAQLLCFFLEFPDKSLAYFSLAEVVCFYR
ncbi:MAG: ArsR family transcriptional regulator [Candidatus Diapherotrites archaeon]|nr:ArsR family transcriptional regulator [Candidatus Diapherotrites archaeon]